MGQKVSREDFIASWHRNGGSATGVSKELGLAVRGVLNRRRNLESLGYHLPGANHPSQTVPQWAYHRMRSIDLDSGVVIVYSDAHYWPNSPTTQAFQALITLCKYLDPSVIVANGDLIDGSSISSHPPEGWSRLPSMKDELEEMKARQSDIMNAAPKAIRFRTVGNHDKRFDRYVAQNADKFSGLPGTRLSDFLPDWPESYSVKINDTFIKHRFRGGVHASWNNVLQAGMSIVTGHLHKLEAKPIRGFREHRVWGVETGTLSNPTLDMPEEGGGPFEYTEDNPTHWASGFAVLTYYRGALLPPEFCSVEFGHAWFRGSKV